MISTTFFRRNEHLFLFHLFAFFFFDVHSRQAMTICVTTTIFVLACYIFGFSWFFFFFFLINNRVWKKSLALFFNSIFTIKTNTTIPYRFQIFFWQCKQKKKYEIVCLEWLLLCGLLTWRQLFIPRCSRRKNDKWQALELQNVDIANVSLSYIYKCKHTLHDSTHCIC